VIFWWVGGKCVFDYMRKVIYFGGGRKVCILWWEESEIFWAAG